MLILIPLFPLLGFIVNGLLGKSFSRLFVFIVGCFSIFISFVLSFVVLWILLISDSGSIIHNSFFTWMQSASLNIAFGFRVDALSAVMINVVTGVGFLIHLYSVSYMRDDEGAYKFFAYLNLFTFAMLVLVMADNLVLLFLGWEGVGLCSYLLIGFWYNNVDFASAGKKAFIVNRVGDFGFLLGIFLIFSYFGVVDFASIESIVRYDSVLVDGFVEGGIVTAITLLLFVGAIGKSAQIPLYVWLPDAMAGPTPVSALIHAATMVTAGVYMIGRLHYLFVLSELTMLVILVVGGVTALYAGTIAISQNDIKKVLAYSTVSQLGYMFMAMAVGAFSVGIFHLVTHAFFKALLFLGSGSVILAMHHEQDMLLMGRLYRRLPVTHITMLLGVLALSGTFPYMSGFMSKDLILESVKSFDLVLFGYNIAYIFWVVAVMGALFTAFYSFRLMGMTFWGRSTNMSDESFSHVREPSFIISFVLIVLAVLSVFGGLLGFPGFFGGGIHSFLGGVFGFREVLAPHISLPTFLGIIFAVIAGIMYGRGSRIPDSFVNSGFGGLLHRLSYNKYYVDEAYDFLFVGPIIRGSKFLWKWVDIFIIDGIVNGVARFARVMGYLFQNLQGGNISGYAFTLFLGMVGILLYLFFSFL